MKKRLHCIEYIPFINSKNRRSIFPIYNISDQVEIYQREVGGTKHMNGDANDTIHYEDWLRIKYNYDGEDRIFECRESDCVFTYNTVDE